MIVNMRAYQKKVSLEEEKRTIEEEEKQGNSDVVKGKNPSWSC
jgi:hypothetical protein